MACTCSNCYQSCQTCTCYVTTGCPLQLDSECVLYHKNNSEVSELTNLGIANGTTLEYILEVIDTKINNSGSNILNYNLPCLRETYTVNTLQQFMESIDDFLCVLSDKIEVIENSNYQGIFSGSDPVDGDSLDGITWWRSDLSELRGYFDGTIYIITTTPA